MFNVWEIISIKYGYEGVKTAGVTDYTNETPPKHFGWIKYLSLTDLKKEKIYIKCAQNRRCTSSICEQPLWEVWIKRNESFWSYRLHKLGTPKVLQTDGQREGLNGPTTRPAFAGNYGIILINLNPLNTIPCLKSIVWFDVLHPSEQLRSCQDGQFTLFPGQDWLSG